MKTCCGHTTHSLESMLKYCREHCKETAGCYSVSLDKVTTPYQPPRKLLTDPLTTFKETCNA
jgi:hypothetical protein